MSLQPATTVEVTDGTNTVAAATEINFTGGSATVTPNGTIADVAVSGGGSGLDQLTGDVTAGPGTGSQVATLASVNSDVGTYQGLTVNAKGLVTAAVNESYLTGNQSITLSGDVSGSGATAITATLANVNSDVGTYQGITVNAKGLVTAAVNENYLTANQTITLSGDVTGSGTTSITATLDTVNSDVGTYTNPSVTVNGKGLVTAISNNPLGPFLPLITAVPTETNTGFSTWVNQGSVSATNSAIGLALSGPSQSSSHALRGLKQAAPSTPYTVTALLFPPCNTSGSTGAFLGWYDGSAKYEGWFIIAAGNLFTWSAVYSEWTAYNSAPTDTTEFTGYGSHVWLQLVNNGTNVSLNASMDGINYITFETHAISGGFLSSYADLFYGIDNYSYAGFCTLAGFST